jgi:undecaprenyl-diphosphatase
METLAAYDLGVLYSFGGLHRPWLNDLVITLTHFGDLAVLGLLAALLTALFLLMNQSRLAGGFALICLLSLGMQIGVKAIVQRPRPQVVWRLIPLPNEPSFPSGHSLCSMAIYTTAGLLIGRLLRRHWLARLVPILGLGIGVMIGLTRPYLGVHYPMDVLAGWVGGLGLALVGSSFLRPLPSPSD